MSNDMTASAADPMGASLMYHVVPGTNKLRVIAVRGSNKLEGFHKHFNRLLSSGNTSPELAGPLMCHFVGDWNIDRAFYNIGDPDYGTLR